MRPEAPLAESDRTVDDCADRSGERRHAAGVFGRDAYARADSAKRRNLHANSNGNAGAGRHSYSTPNANGGVRDDPRSDRNANA